MHRYGSVLVVVMGVCALLFAGTTQASAVAGTGQGLFTGLSVTGTAGFRGTVEVQRFRQQSGSLVADALVNGTYIDSRQNETHEVENLSVVWPVAKIDGTCQGVALDFGTQALNSAAGVRLDGLHVDIPAPDPDSLLHDRVCRIAVRLERGTGPVGVLEQLNDLARLFS